jgi:hypothetical protein
MAAVHQIHKIFAGFCCHLAADDPLIDFEWLVIVEECLHHKRHQQLFHARLGPKQQQQQQRKCKRRRRIRNSIRRDLRC